MRKWCRLLGMISTLRAGSVPAPVAQASYAETDAARAAREKHVENARLASAFAQPRSLDRPDKPLSRHY